MDDLFVTADPTDATASRVHVGIGGWVYAPWRGGTFYPPGLVQRRELEYASRQLTAIEINGTYYGAQKPATYAKWRSETPPGFLFSAKAPQRIMASRRLEGTGTQVEDFIGGIVELGDRLGALLWQFDRGQSPAPEALAAFLDLLPSQAGGVRLRHALELRDPGLFTPALLEALRARNVALVFAGSDEHPCWADATADFSYARLMQSRPEPAQGYSSHDLDLWARRARQWAAGDEPGDLPRLATTRPPAGPREVFVFFIAGTKERNPAAAQALIARLREPASPAA